jgi:hypothetical protein
MANWAIFSMPSPSMTGKECPARTAPAQKAFAGWSKRDDPLFIVPSGNADEGSVFEIPKIAGGKRIGISKTLH